MLSFSFGCRRNERNSTALVGNFIERASREVADMRYARTQNACVRASLSALQVLYLQVPDEMLIERVVGRRLDPETGKIYHLKFAPPESDEVAARLTQRSDDTEEKARVRLQAFHKHMSAVESCYTGIISYVDGTKPKTEVFAELQKSLE
eukprot:6186604-Pleurochrysis_carterae.AAC.3